MAKLNLETFNDILVNKGGIDEEELLEMEIASAYGMKIEKMEMLVGLLNKDRQYKEVLKEVNNIDSNLNLMGEKLEKIRARKEEKND